MITKGVGTYGHVSVKGQMNSVIIGNYTSIGENVVCDGGMNHNTSYISNYPFKTMIGVGNETNTCKGDIIIGSDVWIGDDVLIMGGVKIGHGAIIASKSKVTRNVSPFAVWGGYPARRIRGRFGSETIKSLLNIKWWNWDEEKIKENALLLSSNNIDEFIKQHEVRNSNS